MTRNQFMRLSKAERRREVQRVAMLLARETYRDVNPGCTDDVAFTHAERVWRYYTDRALDLLAVAAALEEREILSN